MSAFGCSGGTIYLGSTRVDRPMADSLRAIFADEYLAACAAGDDDAAWVALNLCASVQAAMALQCDWLGPRHAIIRANPITVEHGK